MRKVMVYETNDGRQFKDRADARNHEAGVVTIEKLRQLLKDSIMSSLVERGNIDNVLKHMLILSKEIIAVLKLYHKKLPKRKKIMADVTPIVNKEAMTANK